jgi:RNA polymerase sigma-70 factor (ECF subfamily)
MQNKIQELSEQSMISSILAQSPGWRDLLSVLLSRHHESLLIRCHLYLRNRQDAEDAAQETELRVFRAIQSFRMDSSFRTWLFAIADRQCHDLARKRSRHMLGDQIRALIEIHEDSLVPEPGPGETRDLVSAALTKLPRRERDILMLRFHADLSFQDMAGYLGIGLSATKMRFYRALELFGNRLQREHLV